MRRPKMFKHDKEMQGNPTISETFRKSSNASERVSTHPCPNMSKRVRKFPKTFENENEEKRQGVCSQLKWNEMFTARELPVRALQILKFVHFS